MPERKVVNSAHFVPKRFYIRVPRDILRTWNSDPREIRMSIAERTKQDFEAELRTKLQSTHMNEFVAIEPVSKSFYVESFVS